MTSNDLRNLERQYYNLIESLRSAIANMGKIPNELETVDNHLKQNFTINDTKVDRGLLLSLSSRLEQNISNLRNHINNLEAQIRELNDQIIAKELEEKQDLS